MIEQARISDVIAVEMSRGLPEEEVGIWGYGTWEKFGPDFELLSQGTFKNLVTQVGDQIYGERGGLVSGAAAGPVGAKLGTGSTAVAKTGAGAGIVTYLSGSNILFDSTWPQSSLNGSSRRIQYKFTWGPGVATTATPITEVVIHNAANTDVTSVAANCMSRAIIAPGAKAAGDTLVVTWNHDLLGA